MFKVKKDMPQQEFFGETPAPFIGHYGYPYLNVGVLSVKSGTDDSWEYDAPRYWAKENYEIPEIVNFRSCLINSRFKAHAQDSGKLLDVAKEVGLSSLPVDIELKLKDRPKFKLSTDPVTAPTGPFADLDKAEIAEDPSVHTKVEKVHSDTDLKANDAVLYLYQNNFDENFLSKVLSVGNIGIGRNRKLVPTRWSITAVDDNVGKYLSDKIRDNPHSDHKAYFGGYLGNYYLILVFSDVWSYELFEMYLPKASWNQSDSVSFVSDHEGFSGRKNYAENTAGGYYAARLPILEKLNSLKNRELCLL